MNDLAAYSKLPQLLGRHMSLYVVATGAGAGIQDALWRVCGASSFLQGASFPYSPQESADFAGLKPEQYVSQDFALDLAFAAYMRAIDLNDPADEPVGLAVTASVATSREHRGDHRAHVVCMTRERIVGRTFILEKGVGDAARQKDGRIVDGAALGVLAASLGLAEPQEQDVALETAARVRFFEHPVFWPDGRRLGRDGLDPSWPLFPGAFDPPHEGHEKMADHLKHWGQAHLAADAMKTAEPVFTICANPPHKEALSVQEMLRRAKRLRHRITYFTENDPFYIDKARAHPGTPLVIGADALLRMLDPKWGLDVKAMFAEFRQLGTKFMLFGREVNGEFLGAEDAFMKLPHDCWDLFIAMGGRWDVSSTALRHPPEGCTTTAGSDPTRSEVQPAP